MTQKTQPSTPLHHLYLVDASGFIFRAFHAIQLLTRSDGTPVNAVYGFITMLMKLLADMQAEHIAIIFDAARGTFRNDLSPAYKANRPDPPDELVPQFGLVREATRAFNLDCIEKPGFEADDLIATYTHQAVQAGAQVTIVSSDKDLMQLVSDRVNMYDTFKNRWIGPAEVQEKFGVLPEKVVEVQALAGDPTDNIPGVPGIGIKTAAQLINEYGDLETLLRRAPEIKQPKRRQSLVENGDNARLARQLVLLRTDVPLTIPLEGLMRRPIDQKELTHFLQEQGFQSIIARMNNRLSSQGSQEADSLIRKENGKTAINQPQYDLVQSLPALHHWVAEATRSGIVAVDTETTSLDQSRAALVGVSLCMEAGQACYIPLAHAPSHASGGSSGNPSLPMELHSPLHADAKNTWQQIPFDQALEVLRPLMVDPSVLKVGHNIKYDMVVLEHYGISVNPVDDTMLLSYALESGRHGHGMDELAQLYLGHVTIKYKDVTGSGKSQVTFDRVPLDQALHYAAEDADITLRLYQLLKPRLVREHMVTVYETLERPLIPVLASMEKRGIQVDVAQLKRLSAEFAQRLGVLEQQIHRLAGRPFNVASPKQLGEILFKEMGLEGGQKGKAGAYSTGATVLESLAAEGHALPATVLEWRHLDKLKSTYTDALVHQINPRTHRVHTSFSMAAASTGRLSSTDPNLQNIPVRTEEGRKIRRAFVAEPGKRLLSLDYSQVELRLLAHIAEIAPLKQAFRDGQDIHALTASQVFAMPIDQIDSEMRRKAKAINFGIIYGISAFGLARQLHIDQSEAAAYIQAYFDRYPGIQGYMERTKQYCREQGYVQTLFGRRCYIPGIHDNPPPRRNFAERAAINAPIQGTAADIIKRAMIRVPPALAQCGLTARSHMLLTVHDELLFEVEQDALGQTADVIKPIMESATLPALQLSVPLTVDVGHGTFWDETH